MQPVAPVVLADDVVVLEPLSTSHAEHLHRASSGDRSSFAMTFVPSSIEGWAAYIAGFLDEQSRGHSIPFATLDGRTRQIIGSTRFLTIELSRIRAKKTVRAGTA
jgi:hypothetical protein